MFWSVFVFLFVVLVFPAESAKKDPVYPLPSYIKKACSRNDPNFNKCVVEIGGPAIETVVKGDPKYRIPELDPMLIKELRIKQGTKQVGLELLCIECKLWGLHKTKFVKADVDWKKEKCTWFFKLDKLKVTGKYNVSGQVLLLPIVGDGDLTMDLENMTFSYNYEWKEEKKSNGYSYAIIGNNSFPFKVGHMSMQLENLFNGDPLLGGNMNRFLNEHWEEILKDLNPALSKALAQLTTSVLSNMAKLVPMEIMFPIT